MSSHSNSGVRPAACPRAFLGLRKAGAFLLTALLLTTVPGEARNLAARKQQARTQYDRAEQLREALNGRPAKQRTARDYEKVISAYRQVYFTAPTSNKADASALAAAELMAESARAFHNIKGFHSSIEQYEFLRREYPGSRYRMGALFSIGQIYREDLLDFTQAKITYQEFLKLYPGNHLAEQARSAISEMDADLNASKSHTNAETARNADTTAQKNPFAPTGVEKNGTEKDTHHTATSVSVPVIPKHQQRNQLTLVTGIRHWSTPDYTRIAIDIDQEVNYEAGRVPSPDRIFFDLNATRLAPELSGKTFDVGDGFLKKIRIAQFKSNMTRVVLEVDQLADYSAFLLPNPYRLIIDIHGKQPASVIAARNRAEKEKEATNPASASQNQKLASTAHNTKTTDAAAEHKDHNAIPAATHEASAQVADTSHDHAATANKTPVAEKTAEASSANTENTASNTPVSTAKDTEDLSLMEIADLNKLPDEVDATNKPTNSPIAQTVSPREVETAREKIASENDASASANKTTSTTKSTTATATHKTRHGTTTDTATNREAQPTATGERSLIRALGLKIGKIVIDAGHGGHDTGTIGPDGLLEKDLVLDVALRLGKLLEQKLGAEVVYTRSDDTFVPLETRTAIANKMQADLFISVHANSSRDPSARGVETYYLNFTASPDAMEVAARENAVSEKSIHELQDLVKKIALKEKIEESREFASDVQEGLFDGFASKAGMKNRGVKKAPFIVLIGANMPSILAEISFVSNPRDEKKLRTPDYRQKIAESLAHGVEKYVAGLSGIKLASSNGLPAQGGN